MRNNHARSIRIAIAGTDHFRAWLADHLADEGRRHLPGSASITVVAGPALAVTCRGFSTCEEDDADSDTADAVAVIVDAVADEYPGDEGRDRWGESDEPAIETYNRRAVLRSCEV